MARAFGLQPKGRRFDSDILHNYKRKFNDFLFFVKNFVNKLQNKNVEHLIIIYNFTKTKTKNYETKRFFNIANN